MVLDAFDSGVHVSEEVSNARVAVPIAIVAPAVVSAVLGFGKSFPKTPFTNIISFLVSYSY